MNAFFRRGCLQRILVAGIIAMMLSFSQAASSTMIIPSTLEYMTNAVDSIVVGTVKSRTSYWEDKKIFTDVVIEVQDVVKYTEEKAPATVTLKILGGQVGDTRMDVDQAPVFQVGKKNMLFLKKEADGKYHSFGISYGVFQVIFDSSLQKEIVDGPYFRYTEHVDLSTRKTVRMASELLQDESKGLDAFVTRIKNLIK